MRTTSMIALSLGSTAFVLAAYDAFAAKSMSRRQGHPEITFDVARSAHLPPDLAKVVALGSIAPDYFEFDEPAAHAQTPDPNPSEHDLASSSRKGFENSTHWHDSYFAAAVGEAKAGHRERAAFLLGYALHNTEDFATHKGMTNLEHAALAARGDAFDPDLDKKRLAIAHARAAAEVAEFERALGDDDLRLFRGEAIRRNPGSVGSEVPDALGSLTQSLAAWDPRAEKIPPPTSGAALGTELLDASLDQLRHIYPDQFAEVENVMVGILPRQDLMLGLLTFPEDLAHPDGATGERLYGLPKLPRRKGFDELLAYAADARAFEEELPARYKSLGTEVKQRLHDTANWEALGRARLAELVKKRDAELAAEAAAQSLKKVELDNRDRAELASQMRMDGQRQLLLPPPPRDVPQPPALPATAAEGTSHGPSARERELSHVRPWATVRAQEQPHERQPNSAPPPRTAPSVDLPSSVNFDGR